VSLRDALAADYRAYCVSRGETGRSGRLRAAARFALNPSLHAVVLLRLSNAGPRWLARLWRHVLLSKHSIDASHGVRAGPGLLLPHPLGIVIAPTVRIGANVRLLHNVTLAGDERARAPVVGDDVTVYAGAVIVGGVTIGDRCVIGANSLVTRDVPPDSIVKRDRIEPLRDSSLLDALRVTR
jgi:serine O-acetyltransferase